MTDKDLFLLQMGEYPFDKLFRMNLVPKKGIDFFYCGMPLSILKEVVLGFTYNKHYTTEGGWFSCSFIFGNSIQAYIDISVEDSKAKVSQISFFNDFKGTYQGIGIGTLIKDIKHREDLYFDEQYVLIGKEYPYDFILEVENQDSTIWSWDDVIEKKITKISVRI